MLIPKQLFDLNSNIIVKQIVQKSIKYLMFESFEKRAQTYSPYLTIPFNPDPQLLFLDIQSHLTQKTSPSKSTKKAYGRDLSLRSISPNTKKQIFHIPNLSPSQFGQSRSIQGEPSLNNYHQIERVLKEQNSNLKLQNQHLMLEIKRLNKVKRKHKQICFSQQIELEQLNEECEAQRKRAEEMKAIMVKLQEIQAQALENQQFVADSEGLIRLSLSESGVHQQRLKSYTD